MSYASQAGRARTNPSSPQAHAICDRCGFRYNRVDLRWQFDWRGASIANLRILVCNNCYDKPQEQLRAIVLPADPVPVDNPRIEIFSNAENDIRSVSGSIYGSGTDPITGIPIVGNTLRVTSSGGNATSDYRVTQEVGASSKTNSFPSLDPNAVMPLYNQTAYGVVLPVNSMSADGTTVISVTCSAAHGLSTGAQISVSGTVLSTTNGFYNVTVTSPTQFTYPVATAITAGSSILLASTIVKTAFVGVPRDMDEIPQTGPL